jgi:hypothetical protein
MEHKVKGGVHLFEYPEHDVFVRVDRISSSRNYINGHMVITVGDKFAFNGNVKLTEQTAKQQVVRSCDERYPDITRDQWDSMVEEVCLKVDRHAYAGSKPVVLADVEISSKDNYLIYPLVLAGSQGTMIFAHGGSLKSYLAAYLAVVAATEKNLNVLVLDWETYDEEWAMRLHHICTGLGFESIPRNITYRTQASSLADSGDVVHELVAECNAGLIIVDSLMGALQGQLVESGPAAQFFETLRSFAIPSLIVHHVNAEGGAYGGVYLHNYVRLKWNLKALPHSDGKNIDLTAKAEKANNDSRGQEIKWRVKFDITDNRRYTPGDAVTFTRTMLNSNESTSGSAQEAIWAALGDKTEHRDNLMAQTGLPELDFNRYVMDMLLRKQLVEVEGGYLARKA